MSSAVEDLIDVRREEWLPRSPSETANLPRILRPPESRTAVEIHHGGGRLGSRDAVNAWRDYWRYHVVNRGWQDIWYNLGIHPDGRLFELRGAWAANSSRPFLTVNLPGHGDVDSTEAQFETLHRLRLAFQRDTGSQDLTWHAVRGGTICPGPVVINRIKNIKAAEAANGELKVMSTEFITPESDNPMLPNAVGPLVGPITVPGESGYYVVGSDGGVFAFGDLPFFGSLPGKVPTHDSTKDQIVGFAPYVEVINGEQSVEGYYLMSRLGAIFAFGAAPWDGRVERII